MKPVPFEGTSLIPLNLMDKKSDLYEGHARKYKGREDLMNGIIPKLDCKWNDVVQFSALDPQLIVNQLKNIEEDFKLIRTEYFKIHVDQIIRKFDSVVFDRNKKQKKGDFTIHESEVVTLDNSYQELRNIPKETIQFWNEVKSEGGKFLWFAFIPHILVKGIIDTKDFEICTLK
jgi:hypothetical protein